MAIKVGTCEKCAKASNCSSVKDHNFTGVCGSFLSYSKKIQIESKRNTILVKSHKTALVHNPFTVLKSLEVK